MVAKLTDVAKLAGVSPTTVSRVINKKKAIYTEKKPSQKVNEAMRELGYKPNKPLLDSLRKGKIKPKFNPGF